MLYRCVMQDLCEKRQIFFLPLLKGLRAFLYRNLCHIPAECSHNESIHVIWLSSYMHYQRLCVPSAHNYCTGNVLYGRGSANKQLTFIIDYGQIYVSITSLTKHAKDLIAGNTVYACGRADGQLAINDELRSWKPEIGERPCK